MYILVNLSFLLCIPLISISRPINYMLLYYQTQIYQYKHDNFVLLLITSIIQDKLSAVKERANVINQDVRCKNYHLEFLYLAQLYTFYLPIINVLYINYIIQ